MQAEYDEGGAIGRRYRRQDEIGTPFCLTIDHQSLEDRTVTLRDRDSLAQERLPIEGIAEEIERRVMRAVEDAKARLRGRDMDFDLTDEQRLIKETAREFTDNEIVRSRAKTRATTTSTSTWSRRSPTRATSARSSRRSTAARGSTTSATA